MIEVIRSWLQRRRAAVVLGGERSAEYTIENQVFQGTVNGPILWDVFFEDVNIPIKKASFKDVEFAHDLNAYRAYDGYTSNKTIMKHARKCQTEVHTWGRANQVVFEPTKESVTIISNHEPERADFK